MRISVVRTAGFSEPRRSATLDDSEVPDELRPSIDALADLAATLRTTRPVPVLRSQPHYAITLHGDRPELLTIYESQVPASVRPLLDHIMRDAL